MSQTTERAIALALKKLLQQKPLNKITISDIANECGINRMTFYYHFKDIYDLIEWIFTQEAEESLKGNETVDNWQQGTLNLLHTMLNDKTFIMGIIHSISREQIELYTYRVFYSLFRKAIDGLPESQNVAEKDRKFIADFYKFALSGVLIDWVESGMKEEPEVLVQRMDTLIRGDFVRGLDRFNRAGTGTRSFSA